METGAVGGVDSEAGGCFACKIRYVPYLPYPGVGIATYTRDELGVTHWRGWVMDGGWRAKPTEGYPTFLCHIQRADRGVQWGYRV